MGYHAYNFKLRAPQWASFLRLGKRKFYCVSRIVHSSHFLMNPKASKLVRIDKGKLSSIPFRGSKIYVSRSNYFATHINLVFLRLVSLLPLSVK